MKPVIELRIHGVGGSTVKEMLGRDPEPKPLTSDADQTSGFWDWSEPKEGVIRRAYLWGRYSPANLGLWVGLLPFTLVNAAGWSVGSGRHTSGGWFGANRHRWSAVISRWAVAILGLSLTAGWTLWMVRIVGDRLALQVRTPGWLRIGWAVTSLAFLLCGVLLRRRAASDRRHPPPPLTIWVVAAAIAGLLAVNGFSELPRGWARGIALAASALAAATPFALAGANRKRFEQYRARLGGTGEARERRRLGDEETLGAPCFYDHPTESAGLLFGHGAIALLLLLMVTARAFILPSAGSNRAPLLDEVGAIGTPFLGHALLYMGLLQGLLVALLVVAGALGASRRSVGRGRSFTSSVTNVVVNALRPASLAGIGVFLFTAVVGVADTVTARIFDERVELANHPELELTPAFIGGALLAGLLVAAAAGLARARSDPPPDDVPDELRGRWGTWQTVRWIVANADRLIVLTGVVLAGCLMTAAFIHRSPHLSVLIPPGEFRGMEVQIIRHVKWLGLAEVFVPLGIFVLALRRDRFRSSISAVWDVLSFWPRRFHPLGVPPQSERSVPEVQSHLLHALEDPEARVEIVAHSQGSVIAFAALAGLRDRGALSQVSLVTMGAPLFALYPRMFPAQVSWELIDELAETLGPGRWVNVHRPTDYFGVPPADPVSIRNVAAPHVVDDRTPRVGPPEYFSRAKARKLVGSRYRTNAEYCGVEAGTVGRVAEFRKIDSDRPLYEVRVDWTAATATATATADGRPPGEGPPRRTEWFSRRDLFHLVPDGSPSPQRAMEPLDGPDGAPGPVGPRLAVHHRYLDARPVEDLVAEVGQQLRSAPARRRPAVPSFAPRRRMVSWFDPRLLALTAYEAGVSAVFGKWADARHVQAIDAEAAAQGVIDLPPSPGGDIWVDFVADPGDAFGPTFAVASTLAQPGLSVGDETLPRGDILVMGGDEVYPAASVERYENQLVGPYALASRCVQDDGIENDGSRHPPLLLAVPGNHDWYDGLGSFDQVFCAHKPIGMWQTCQERSYWAVRLNGSGSEPTWWLWGVDLQLGNRFDRRQLDYFRRQAEHLKEGDLIVLCSPIPTWAHAQAEPTAFDVLSNFVDQEVRPRGALVVLHLSGDSHHYARYERQQLKVQENGETTAAPRTDGMCRVQYVTSGGGGAFTHPTHHLEDYIDLPVPYDDGATTLTLQRRGGTGEPMPRPEPARSRRLITRNLLVVPFLQQNRGFLLVPGVVAAIAAFAVFRGPHIGPLIQPMSPSSLARTVTSSVMSAGLILLVLAGWTAFAKPGRGGSGLVARATGFLHGLAQVAATGVVLWAGPQVVNWFHEIAGQRVREVFHVARIEPWIVGVVDWLALLGTAFVLGGLAGSIVLAWYLVVANLSLKMHDNEAASAVADQNFKHFVRLRIRGGTATAWVLHVPDAERPAEQFAAHDPRPTLFTGGTRVEVWDRFDVGRASGAEPARVDGEPVLE